MNAKHTFIRIMACAILMGVPLVLQASISGTGGVVTRAFTGVWNQPAHESHSTVIQIVDDGHSGLKGVVYLMAFDAAGLPYWYYAEGPVTGDRIDLVIYEASESSTTAPPRTATSNLRVWGSGSIEFEHCEKGLFTAVDSISGTGGFAFELSKESGVADTKCTGGTSDGVNPSDSPVDIRSFFMATPAGRGASGIAEFEISAGRTNFKVEVEDLPVGEYGLMIDGVSQGGFRVTKLPGGGTEGEIEYRSPVEPGKVLLTFDPRDKLVDIVDSSSTVVLSQLFPETSANDSGGLPGGADLEIDIDMFNTGVYPAGDASATFEQRPERSEFSVEVEDIPGGTYDLYVGGEVKGSITVRAVDGGTEGEIEFRSPLEAGKELLDFDPRDQLIEVRQGSTVLFSTDFRSPGGGPDDRISLDFDFVNTGVDENASGRFKYRKFGDKTRAEVRVEDLTVDGPYELYFEHALKGIIMVEKGKGRWRFNTGLAAKGPFPGSSPFGARVAVRRDGVDILIINIPR